MITEKAWVASTMGPIRERLQEADSALRLSCGSKLSYAHEIREYTGKEPSLTNTVAYETDVLITEGVAENVWKPRVVIEAKLGKVTTHDAITYSEKAATHKKVHPYLRYGILIGDRKHYPLPGRFFRHGAYFDFMLSWTSLMPSQSELKLFLSLISSEVQASRDLEEILYASRSRSRRRYTLLHRPLRLETGIAEVEIRKQYDVSLSTPAGEDATVDDIGKQPVACGVSDASENLDQYVSGTLVGE
jgi:hypothetical protein